MSKVILLRHAQSTKNIKKIHGGGGEALTDLGEKQAVEIANWLTACNLNKKLKIYASTSLHTRATAQVIAQQLDINVETPFDFKPLYLGIADGLAEDELKVLSPKASELFVRWRRREIDIKLLQVGGMEPYLSFWERGERLLESFPKNHDILLVCSNSLMILLAHIMAGNNPQSTNNYKHLNIENCGLIVFDRAKDSFLLDQELTTVQDIL